MLDSVALEGGGQAPGTEDDKPEKPMYRSMPAAFFGSDDEYNTDGEPIRPDDTPRYRSLGAMQPAFAGEFSQAPKYRSSFTGGARPKAQAAALAAAAEAAAPSNQNGTADAHYPEVQPQEPIWRSMGAFSDMPNPPATNHH